MSRRILLHVGTPKTGTSHLQEVLFQNRERLLAQGVLYPADRFDAHFLAALDLMRMPWGGLENEAVGAWDRLAAQVREHDGTAIISHEILAAASRSHIDRALASLGDAEVHLLVSARDLVRQIPAEWQENVKHRAEFGYAEFLQMIRDPARSDRVGSWFWGVQDLPDILDRWGATLPAERVHVITVPAPGGARELLWQRFSAAFGLDDLDLELSVEKANVSLGVPESALVRRINEFATRDVPSIHYRPLVRELLAHRTLSRRSDSPRLALPVDQFDWIDDLTQTWVDELAARGYDVVGDLADLRGRAPKAAQVGEVAGGDPDAPDEAQVAAAGVAAIGALVVEAGRRQGEIDRLQAEVDQLRDELAQARKSLAKRTAERTVQRLEASAGGRRALGAYRTARGKNSRPA